MFIICISTCRITVLKTCLTPLKSQQQHHFILLFTMWEMPDCCLQCVVNSQFWRGNNLKCIVSWSFLLKLKWNKNVIRNKKCFLEIGWTFTFSQHFYKIIKKPDILNPAPPVRLSGFLSSWLSDRPDNWQIESGA